MLVTVITYPVIPLAVQIVQFHSAISLSIRNMDLELSGNVIKAEITITQSRNIKFH